MNKTDSRHIIQEMLDLADVWINGDRPWDIQVQNQKFYERVLLGGSLALGESYMGYSQSKDNECAKQSKGL